MDVLVKAVRKGIGFLTWKKMAFLFGGLCVLLAAVLGKQCHNLYAMRQTNQTIGQTLTEWQDLAPTINREKLRPVDADQLDDVTANLMVNAQAHRLGIIYYGDAKQQPSYSSEEAESSSRLYHLSVQGAYADCFAFLRDFHAKDALMTVVTMDAYPVQDKIQMDLRYRVYIREGESS